MKAVIGQHDLPETRVYGELKIFEVPECLYQWTFRDTTCWSGGIAIDCPLAVDRVNLTY